jgi:hypothetical protein
MVIPVAVGEKMGKKQAYEEAAQYTKGCDIYSKEGYYCTLITESGKKWRLGLLWMHPATTWQSLRTDEAAPYQ